MPNRRAKDSGFTLIEVLVAFAIVATALIALVGLQIDSLRTMDRLTHKIEANLWAEDAYVRYILTEQGYNTEDIHPLMREKHPDWTVNVELEELTPEDLPIIPVLPVGWKVDWVNVQIIGDQKAVMSSVRPLWVRSENPDFVSESPGGIADSPGENEEDADDTSDDGPN